MYPNPSCCNHVPLDAMCPDCKALRAALIANVQTDDEPRRLIVNDPAGWVAELAASQLPAPEPPLESPTYDFSKRTGRSRAVTTNERTEEEQPTLFRNSRGELEPMLSSPVYNWDRRR